MKSPRTTWTLTIGAVVVITLLAVSWFVILSPRLSMADELTAQAEQVSMSNLQLQNRFNQGLDLANKAPAAAAEAQAVFAKMPRQADLPKVLEQSIGAAKAAGLPAANIDVIGTSVPTPVTAATTGDAQANATGVNLATIGLNVTVRGGREKLMTFIDNMQSIDRALLVKSTTASSDVTNAAQAEQRLQLDGTMFILQSNLPDLVANVNKLITESTAAP
jgi:hypothetical protein